MVKINPVKQTQSFKGLPATTATKALSTLVNPGRILPVALIEVATTAGRTYQGYKRGGKEEARERICEESISAMFWLFGVKVLNNIGDALGKKIGIKHLDIDVGRDTLRAPSLNISKEELLKTSVYKFSKILGSAVIATALMGFVLPRLNHMVTNMIRKANGLPPVEEQFKRKKKEKAQKTKAAQNPAPTPSAPVMTTAPSFDDFLAKAKNANSQKSISFSGTETIMNALMAASHNLENNATWRLMSTDVGTITGRVANSRNQYEAGEFLFRDTAAVYFYMFATPHVAKFLNWISGNTPIHPDTLQFTKDHLVKAMGNQSFSPDDFLNNSKSAPKDFADILSKIKFDKGVVSLDEFNRATGNLYTAKAKIMSEMQPKFDGKSILSKMQVEDIISSGWNTDPEFLKKAVNAGTYGAALDSKRFVSRKVTEDLRQSIDTFTQNLVNYAKSKDVKTIDANFVEQFAKRTVRKGLAFRLTGMVVAALGLAVLIPKVQYKITEKLTGSKAFPGTADYSDKEKFPNKNASAS